MSTFSYSPLIHDEIRLLHVHPAGDAGGRIICDIYKKRLSEKPEYAALSYTWGDPTEPKEITLNGSSFPVTKNLHGALRNFQSTTWRILWVDAICINQNDEAEKGVQIKMMYQIYSQCLNTFIDFGDGPHGAEARAYM
jgi:hypothetical protein